MSKTPDHGPGDQYEFGECNGTEVGAPVFAVPSRVVAEHLAPGDDNDTAITAAGKYETNQVVMEVPVRIAIDRVNNGLFCRQVSPEGRCRLFDIVSIARGNVRVHVCRFLDDPDGMPPINTPNAAREVLLQIGPVRQRG